MPAPRQMPPKLVRTTAQKRTFLETKWRQIPPHTAQSPARTQLLPDACPTSTWVAWTEFLTQPQWPIRGGGNSPRWHCQHTARPPCTAYRREPRDRYNPTTGIAGRCARAASGHAAAVPPSSAMKSRRLMSDMGACAPPYANAGHQKAMTLGGRFCHARACHAGDGRSLGQT